ncbi:MAG: RluA family pseudouridine synthase [Vicinamibacterales bacterium]
MATDTRGRASFVADRGDGAGRLDQAIQRRLGPAFALSRSAVQRLVAAGGVTVNGRLASRPAQRLATGDVVGVAATPRPARAEPAAERLPLEILFENEDLLVVSKPAGMVAHPTSRQREGTLLNALLWHAGAAGWTPRLVQRLDRGTSGLIVVAKSPAAHAALQAPAARFDKQYLAVVWGRPAPPHGRLEGALGRDPLDRRRMMVRATGAPSKTAYDLLARTTGEGPGLSLVRCRLFTGRTHQIRVHLADRGWPIVGDAVYGTPPRRRLAAPALDRAARAFPRQALHAWRIAFRPPGASADLAFVAPLPADMRELLTGAGLPLPPAA